MRDFGWDFKYGIWLIVGMVLSAPLFIFEPLILIFAVAGALVFFGLRQILRYRGLASWPSVPGKLLQADIGKYRVSVGQYSKPEEYFFPLALFSYEYNGYEGESNQYALDRNSIWVTDSQEAERVVNELKMAESVNVFVNPKNVGEAVLNTKVSSLRQSHARALLASGILLACIGIMLWQYS